MDNLSCSDVEERLFEFHEGQLPSEESALVDQHLQSCDECSQLLNDIWQMGLVSTRWQDQTAGRWNRNEHFERRSTWQMPQMTAIAASVLALVLVLTDTHITQTDDGFRLRVGRDGYVTTEQLTQVSTDLTSHQSGYIDRRFQQLTSQQNAGNQLLLRTMLETSREERKEDLGVLVSYLNANQARQHQQTEAELRYLMASQVEDEKDIKQLSEAFTRIGLQRGSDL